MTITVTVPPSLSRQAAEASARLAGELCQPLPPGRRDDQCPAGRSNAQSLSRGAAGIAILHGIRARDGLASPRTAAAWLSAATSYPLSAAPGAGLWYGAAAVAYAIRNAAPGRYRTAIRQLDQAIATQVAQQLARARARIDASARPPLTEFDLVSGLTGLGIYLLRHRPDDRQLREVLMYLVRLAEPVPASDEAGSGVPGWWTSTIPAGAGRGEFESGNANLGMAHGITGCLALMALSLRQGVTVSGLPETVRAVAAWLEAQRREAPAGPWWPERVTLARLRGTAPGGDGPRRPSWCYGTPGIARALQLASIATSDRALQRRAENALARCLADPAQMARLAEPSACHGRAGILLTAWHAAADASTPALAAAIPPLIEALLASVPAAGGTPGPAGLIDGSAGTAAALHLAVTGRGGWESCLMIT